MFGKLRGGSRLSRLGELKLNVSSGFIFAMLLCNPGGVLPYKGLMGTCGQPGYFFRDFCLKKGIEFIIFCLNHGIDLSIFVLNRINVLNRVSKIGILS